MVEGIFKTKARNNNDKISLPIEGVDSYRAFIFPNNVRKYRNEKNVGSLLQLAQRIPSLTYIRLSKIERGEVFARAEEIALIAAALHVDPETLLIDIDDAGFDIADWAAHFQDPADIDPVAESLAALLAAALRARRAADDMLTITALEIDYGIAPVTLSRVENACKPIERWNANIIQALCRLFEVADAQELRGHLMTLHAGGALDATLPLVANAEMRRGKTRTRVAALRTELTQRSPDHAPVSRRKASQPRLGRDMVAAEPPKPVLDAIHAAESATIRLLPVFGVPLNDGLIARIATGEQVEAPRNAGPRAYGLRMCRPTLGSGLPGRAILVIDPDRFPSAGGLAVVREAEGLRLLSITFDRQGRMLGYSEHPNKEIAIDGIAPADVATVLSAQFE